MPKPVKLMIGIFLKEKSLFQAGVSQLTERFGPLELVSRWFSFDLTEYYVSEMGAPLYRRMLAFGPLIRKDELVEVKLQTHALEQNFSRDGKRRINLDPGYMAREHVVLATGKSFSHRIYIGRGIYGDLTLLYQKGAFQQLPWTYPDYCRKDMQGFLKRVRDKYIRDLQETRRVQRAS